MNQAPQNIVPLSMPWALASYGTLGHVTPSISNNNFCQLISEPYKVYNNQLLSGLRLDRHFYSPSVNSAFYFIARFRRRRSANETQRNFAKRRAVICRKKSGSSQKHCIDFVRFIDDFRTSTNGE